MQLFPAVRYSAVAQAVSLHAPGASFGRTARGVPQRLRFRQLPLPSGLDNAPAQLAKQIYKSASAS